MTFKWIILLLALLGSAYSIVLEIVKYRSANNPTPENVSDVYDAETYQTWKKYSAEHCRLSLIAAAVTCVVTLVMLYTDVYAAFASLFPAGIFWQLFSVVLLETIVGTVVGLFESYVSTMVIEQKYGFNRSTMKTFIADRIRGLIIGAMETSPQEPSGIDFSPPPLRIHQSHKKKEARALLCPPHPLRGCHGLHLHLLV